MEISNEWKKMYGYAKILRDYGVSYDPANVNMMLVYTFVVDGIEVTLDSEGWLCDDIAYFETINNDDDLEYVLKYRYKLEKGA